MTWQLEHFSYDTYGTSNNATIPCVLIAGWSAGSDIFDWLMPGLAQYFQVYSANCSNLPATLEQAVDELAEQLNFDQPALIVAWSLGGNFALDLAYRYPEKVKNLCLLATTPCFIANKAWPHGVEKAAFERLHNSVKNKPEYALQQFDRLQIQGDDDAQALGKALNDYRQQSKAWSTEDLQRGLDYLASCDQRGLLAKIQQTQLWCFGENDAVVSFSTARAVQKLAPKATLIPVKNSGHLPFLKRPDQVFSALLSLSINSVEENKQKIAMSFSRAAETYDEAAKIQAWAADHLFANVKNYTADSLVLDIGCGTGKNTAKLAEKAPSVIGLDIAQGMIDYAKQQYPQLHFIAADGEDLPFDDGNVEAIYSNLATQWSQQALVLFDEWFRVLKPGGKVWLSTLADKSLIELRNSFAKADNEPHVNVFPNIEQWQHYIEHAGFTIDQQELIKRTDYYQKLPDLLRSLKNIGAQTVLFRKAAKPMSKKRWQLLQSMYERHRRDKGLPLSYQVVFFSLSKPE